MASFRLQFMYPMGEVYLGISTSITVATIVTRLLSATDTLAFFDYVRLVCL